ncbi:MAG: hypothetical protein CSA20_09315 [Deltaproteobacteria bacterium]|nr:MAG: hypothetical protein CSB23_00165 [Deltaproteobacteria bacterium]PIE72138.1 MAG: hypothetical protein CSA20_09315 [Deltaproteobacteria bacterium]
MIVYSLRNILQRYAEQTVLDIDRLDIESGHIHALLGANGAGKTTLLEILAFLSSPVQGKILFQGQQVETSNLQRLREKVVLVDQHPVMFSCSVAENVGYGLRIRKTGKKTREKEIEKALELVDLGRYKKKNAKELSGGEKQRLALARALALSPDVLLCDEPTANVDLANSRSIEALLKRICAELQTTIVFTSHDRMQPATLTDRHIILEKGRITTTRYQNSFRYRLQQKETGETVCRLENTSLELHREALTADSLTRARGRISINPEKVVLRREKAKRDTGEIGRGVVLAIMTEQNKVCLILDIGVPLSVLLPQEVYQQLKPAVGERLYISLALDACSFEGENAEGDSPKRRR